jgi:hypothetical protein
MTAFTDTIHTILSTNFPSLVLRSGYFAILVLVEQSLHSRPSRHGMTVVAEQFRNDIRRRRSTEEVAENLPDDFGLVLGMLNIDS